MVSHTKDAEGNQNPYVPLKYVYLGTDSPRLGQPENTYRSSWLNILIIVPSILMFIAFISCCPVRSYPYKHC